MSREYDQKRLLDRLSRRIETCDEAAKLVSNIGKPRSDNDWGRMAQILEDAKKEIERLQAQIDQMIKDEHARLNY